MGSGAGAGAGRDYTILCRGGYITVSSYDPQSRNDNKSEETSGEINAQVHCQVPTMRFIIIRTVDRLCVGTLKSLSIYA